ncbi:DeoR/GlpR family DNA-binding transcription regulator [Streptomyces luomodiensis]|uniref:DeoR/GlpR family DNA-binding transcription regulator n=1 Tax=Streptomyces luomodiensis TaxID=3026192 RepID=A0ABY9UPI7_9ACTN|nr:DeoR/GlpR family DNA-binding transcription regulator [Streptomyces sp. SCA4-21]WNE94457.1 DeoR/GlpR family DNA-binding transcription regulator [Streptomyces sp. SCA4-21]
MSESSADRRRAILENVRALGYAGAGELARTFCVDGSTIRRDLAQLERAGLVRRTRGGVLPADPAEAVDTPYDVRRVQHAEAKHVLGQAAAELVEDGQSVIIDNGSTMYQVAQALRRRHRLTVITNDLMVALCMSEHATHQLHMTGGVLLDTVYTLVGPGAVASLRGLHADWAFLGAEAVHPQAGVTNVNVVEIAVKQAMIEAAERVVVVADSSKLGRRSLAPVCGLESVHALITDDRLPPSERTAYGPALRCVPAPADTHR